MSDGQPGADPNPEPMTQPPAQEARGEPEGRSDTPAADADKGPSEGQAEGRTTPAEQREGAHLEPSKSVVKRASDSPGWRLFWITLAAGLAVLVLAPAVTPLPSLPLKAIHVIYVLVTDTQGQEDLKNAIKGRPYWERPPNIYGDSLDAAINPGPGDPSETNGQGNLTLAIHSIPDVAANGPAFAGYVTEIVGKVRSQLTLSTDITSEVGVEYELTGSTPGAVAYVGVASDATPAFNFSNGDIALIRGVVVASGLARQLDGSTKSAVYIYGLDGDSASNYPAANGLVAAIQKAPH
jgi:hypothetical protein